MSNFYDSDGNRKVPYVEDSTKGRSQIIPLNYKGDINSQAWIDSRILATLTMWLDKHGFYPRTLSEVVREPLKILVEYLVDKEEIQLCDSTADARRLLSSRFRINLSKGQKNAVHNKVLSAERGELGEILKRNPVNDIQTAQRSRTQVTKEDMDKMLEIMKELKGD